jgi:hypothetical protein
VLIKRPLDRNGDPTLSQLPELICDRCTWPKQHGCTCTDATLDSRQEAKRRRALARTVKARHRAAVHRAKVSGWASNALEQPRPSIPAAPASRRRAA